MSSMVAPAHLASTSGVAELSPRLHPTSQACSKTAQNSLPGTDVYVHFWLGIAHADCVA